MDIYSFLIQILNSVQYGLLLFLVASGLTLIFGIMGIINLAHGSFYMIGAYMAYSLSSLTGSLFMAIVLGVILSVALGMLLEWGLFSHLYKRDHLEQVLLTYGLILIFEELRSLIVGNDVHGVNVPEILNRSIALTETLSYPIYRLFMSMVCLVLAAMLYALIRRTRLGMMIRAGASNREMVQSLGLNINLVYRLVFALGVALAAFAGMIAAPVSSVYPGMGNAGAHHLLRRGGDRRHRLGVGRTRGRVAHRLRGHVRQGAHPAGRRRDGLSPDGCHPAVEARRPLPALTCRRRSPKLRPSHVVPRRCSAPRGPSC